MSLEDTFGDNPNKPVHIMDIIAKEEEPKEPLGNFDFYRDTDPRYINEMHDWLDIYKERGHIVLAGGDIKLLDATLVPPAETLEPFWHYQAQQLDMSRGRYDANRSNYDWLANLLQTAVSAKILFNTHLQSIYEYIDSLVNSTSLLSGRHGLNGEYTARIARDLKLVHNDWDLTTRGLTPVMLHEGVETYTRNTVSDRAYTKMITQHATACLVNYPDYYHEHIESLISWPRVMKGYCGAKYEEGIERWKQAVHDAKYLAMLSAGNVQVTESEIHIPDPPRQKSLKKTPPVPVTRNY